MDKIATDFNNSMRKKLYSEFPQREKQTERQKMNPTASTNPSSSITGLPVSPGTAGPSNRNPHCSTMEQIFPENTQAVKADGDKSPNGAPINLTGIPRHRST